MNNKWILMKCILTPKNPHNWDSLMSSLTAIQMHDNWTKNGFGCMVYLGCYGNYHKVNPTTIWCFSIVMSISHFYESVWNQHLVCIYPLSLLTCCSSSSTSGFSVIVLLLGHLSCGFYIWKCLGSKHHLFLEDQTNMFL